MNDSPEIRLIRDDAEYNEILKVRKIVFIQEQNVPSQIEFDGLDKESIHVIIKLNNKTIGCARIRTINGNVKLERIVILKEFRGKGFGKKLVEYLISYCKQIEPKEIIIYAQYNLKDFYRKFGFKTRGNTFMEAGIKHIEMYI